MNGKLLILPVDCRWNLSMHQYWLPVFAGFLLHPYEEINKI